MLVVDFHAVLLLKFEADHSGSKDRDDVSGEEWQKVEEKTS